MMDGWKLISQRSRQHITKLFVETFGKSHLASLASSMPKATRTAAKAAAPKNSTAKMILKVGLRKQPATKPTSRRKKAKEEGKTGDKRATPKSKCHYHVMLIKEISSVMRHLNSSPPRKYSFDDWAWYLNSSAKTNRRPKRTTKRSEGRDARLRGGSGVGTDTGRKMGEKETVKWSGIGNRSPLMGNKEEAEWVLERMTRTLKRELEEMHREEMEGRGDWAPGRKMEGKEPLWREGYRDGKVGGKRYVEDVGEKRRLETDEEGPSSSSSQTVTRERGDGDEIEDENV
jgi:hypothetical protein